MLYNIMLLEINITKLEFKISIYSKTENEKISTLYKHWTRYCIFLIVSFDVKNVEFKLF